ncbi:endonuclease/exonuclease/phosphatase family protein [Craurococcus roseus]|uniref:Endonuclease/exonuclease/phosphatase family protein n=1 Tax=Craurococcus roseus TaxID=77585 RepID=A0ABN1EIB5_9PROT
MSQARDPAAARGRLADPPRRRGGGAPIAAWAAGLVLVAATALPFIPTDDWWVRALEFPRPALAVLLALTALVAWAALDRRRAAVRVLLAAVLAAFAFQLHAMWPYTPLHPAQVPSVADCAPENGLSLVVANLREGNNGAARFLEEVRRARPDLVFVVEVDSGWIEALSPLEEDYPNRVLHPQDDFWGLALYARLALVEPEVRHLLTGYVPSLRTGLRLRSGAVVEFHGLHPKPPTPWHGTGLRDAELLLAAEAARAGARPAVVGGDLNAAAWSNITGLMRRIGGLVDPRVGRGFFLTFPTWLPVPLRFPIDHVLFGHEFRLRAIELLPDIGSDHLPLLARLCHVPGDARTPDAAPPTEADLRRAREAIENGREDAARGGDGR